MEYTVIRNPQALFFKYQVWAAGEMEMQTSKGYLVKEHSIGIVKKFRTEQEAEDFITYQKDVESFKERTKK